MKDQIKFIAYAYPTSDRAKELGVYKQGGWFVAQSHRQEDRTMTPPYIAQGHDVFSTKDDVDMYQLLKESDGTYSQVACLGQYDPTIRTCVKDAGINLITGEQL